MDKYDYAQAALKFGATAVANHLSRSSTQTLTKRKRSYTSMPNDSVQFTKSRRKVGRTRRRNAAALFKNIIGTKAEQISRWSSMSPALTGPGRIPIAFGTTEGATEFQCLPFMFASLTTCPLIGEGAAGDNVVYGAWNTGLNRVFQTASDGSLYYQPLRSSQNDGVSYPDPFYKGEKNYVIPGGVAFGRRLQPVFHKYTDLRLNLYASYYYPLDYNVSIVQMPKEWNPHQFSPYSPIAVNSEFGTWVRDVVRSKIANPLNMNGKNNWKNHVRVIKNYNIHMPCLDKSDASLATSVVVPDTVGKRTGNVHQFKLFMRHDRFRTYTWAERANQVAEDLNFNDLGWDFTTAASSTLDVEWDKRMYLIVTCTCPPLVTVPVANSIFRADLSGDNPDFSGGTPDSFGSIDCIIRQSFMHNQAFST